ncbi:MAG TPA: PEP-CTERM sorting domain-containing protein [Lacipirellulaceae bacterium]|nr:PEP-CTERM sorting domain-containing protein [Lacipirellulaceae bacterium]
MADLVNGAVMGLKVGDKEFTGFSYSRIGDMPPSDNVRVLGFRDSGGNWGISFHGAFLDLPGGSFSDALIRFMVNVAEAEAAAGWRINGANLFIGGAGAGGPDSAFIVDESFQENDVLLEAYVTTLGGAQQAKTSDSATFAPVVKLNVTKDILAIAAAGNSLPARATVIDQSFTQIPEPTSLALLGMTGLAMVSVVRRRR